MSKQKATFNDLTIGVEIELVGIERDTAAEAIKSVVGGNVRYLGGAYNAWSVTDESNRVWKIVSDSSLDAPRHLQVEVVSPILKYDDIETLQEVLRALRRAGSRTSPSAGVHIHIGQEPFNVKQLANLAKMVYKNEELYIHALGIHRQRMQYTQRMNQRLIDEITAKPPKTIEDLNKAIYGYYNDCPEHYNSARYSILNLHAAITGPTIEFRAANSTLHSGKLRSYILLVMSLALKALNSKCASSKKKAFNEESARYDMRVILLNLGWKNSPIFKNPRKHLLANMPGSSAFKTQAQADKHAAKYAAKRRAEKQ
jgi:hypothetical protein